MNGTQRDDVVLWVVISFCLLTPVVLASLWAFQNRFYPPMLLAVLLGIAIAALTYRYLGGTLGSEFSVGVLKVAGSAALLLGTAYLTNQGLSEQMDVANSANKLASAISAEKQAVKEKEELRRELDEAKRQIEKVQREGKERLEEANQQVEKLRSGATEILISKIEKMDPNSLEGRALIDMARRRRGPFIPKSLNANVTVVGYVKAKGSFKACEDLDLGDKSVRFVRVVEPEEDVKSVEGRQSGDISVAICKRSGRKFDIQISCSDGLILFPDHISGCSGGSVGWSAPNGVRNFPVSVEVIDG